MAISHCEPASGATRIDHVSAFDAAVVGAGPNGLAAAVELARSGRRVLVVEGAGQIGGGTRTEELTLPGLKHDVCSAIHPAGIASPFFNEIELDVDWVHSPIPLAHPLPDSRATALFRSPEETADQLGADRHRYLSLMTPFVDGIQDVVESVLGPMTLSLITRKMFARSAGLGGLPVSVLAKRFVTEEARALIAGLAAHSIAPFHRPATAAVGIMLGAIGHSHGWPLAKGGSETIARALVERLESLGGVVETGRWVRSVEELPGDIAMLDVMPPTALALAGDRVKPSARRLRRWKPGPGVFKIDWALDGPIPWTDELSRQAATVHVGGTYAEVAAAERAVSRGDHPKRPFVLLAQQSLFDETRSPSGKHTAWGYCHVPSGSNVDMTEAIESQVERFAPGFKQKILQRSTRSSIEMEQHNPNYVGGDIGGGVFGLRKVLQLGRRRPYELGDGVFLCSSATPPGAGVHGMCGYHAARAAVG